VRRVEGLSAREIGRRTGLARGTVSRLLAAEEPPRYSRAPAGSILDPFKDWICEHLQADPKVPSQRLRELAAEIGYAGGKTIFDAYVREVRPRSVPFQASLTAAYDPARSCAADAGPRMEGGNTSGPSDPLGACPDTRAPKLFASRSAKL